MSLWTMTYRCRECYEEKRVEHNEDTDGPRPDPDSMAPECHGQPMKLRKMAVLPYSGAERKTVGPLIKMDKLNVTYGLPYDNSK